MRTDRTPASMRGSLAYPFGEMFRDTCAEHGWLWAYVFYTDHGMSEWEFDFWQKATNSWDMFGRD